MTYYWLAVLSYVHALSTGLMLICGALGFLISVGILLDSDAPPAARPLAKALGVAFAILLPVAIFTSSPLESDYYDDDPCSCPSTEVRCG